MKKEIWRKYIHIKEAYKNRSYAEPNKSEENSGNS